MSGFACPICGDPNAYPIWIDSEPPQGCPNDEAWQTEGGVPAIRNVTECAMQMKRACAEAERRQAAPDCFDENGKIIPEKTAEAFHRWWVWQDMKSATKRGENDQA